LLIALAHWFKNWIKPKSQNVSDRYVVIHALIKLWLLAL